MKFEHALMVPSIHLNGSGGRALKDQVEAALEAIEAALEVLGQAWPHGRDYYPQGEDALKRAQDAWAERINTLVVLRDELMAQYRAINKAGRRG